MLSAQGGSWVEQSSHSVLAYQRYWTASGSCISLHASRQRLAARHALPKEVVDGVTERSGGAPLFVEEYQATHMHDMEFPMLLPSTASAMGPIWRNCRE